MVFTCSASRHDVYNCTSFIPDGGLATILQGVRTAAISQLGRGRFAAAECDYTHCQTVMSARRLPVGYPAPILSPVQK